MSLILASNSASRKAMLGSAGIAFDAMASDFDEAPLKAQMANASLEELALALALAKARDVSARNPGSLVLGGDSIASVDGQRFGKPATRADAESHLKHFSGKTLVLTSAAALVRDGKARIEIVDSAQLKLRTLSTPFIAYYLDAEWPAISGCAGCFRMEAMGVQLFEQVIGDYHTILGMPLLPLLAALRKEGALIA